PPPHSSPLPSFPTRRSSDLLRPVARHLHTAQHRQHRAAMAVVDVDGALAALAGELRQTERPRQPLAVVAGLEAGEGVDPALHHLDRKSTRLNSSHVAISYAV